MSAEKALVGSNRCLTYWGVRHVKSTLSACSELVGQDMKEPPVQSSKTREQLDDMVYQVSLTR